MKTNSWRKPGVKTHDEYLAEKDALDPEGKKFRDSLTEEDLETFDRTGSWKAVEALRKKQGRPYPY